MSDEEREDLPEEERPAAEEPAAEEPAEEQPEAEQPAGPEAEQPAEPEAEEPVAEEPVAEERADEPGPEIEGAEELAAASEPAPERRPPPERPSGESSEEVIPGMHLEPDLVLDEPAREDDQYAQYAEPAEEGEAAGEGPPEAPSEPESAAPTPLDLAADARYRATGKRKSAVARVILKPGEGAYAVNGRHLDEYFPRIRLQRMARQPLEATGNGSRMDVVARIHGGGVSAQAAALRHGIARALVEADPSLRGELKRRGYLTRDPRVKERKKAGLKKARKRPQFSKR